MNEKHILSSLKIFYTFDLEDEKRKKKDRKTKAEMYKLIKNKNSRKRVEKRFF